MKNENGLAGHNAPFDKEVDVRTIYLAGGILLATTLVVQLLLVGLFHVFKVRDEARGHTENPLQAADNTRELQQRLESVPLPHLEGLELEDNQLILRTHDGNRRFYVASSAFIERGREKVKLYDLRVGTRVKVAYWERDQRDVVTTIVTPVPEGKPDVVEKGLSFATGEIVRIEPHTIHGWREWTLVHKDRYSWADRDKKILTIPVDQAMQAVLHSDEVRKAGKATQPAAWLDRPTPSSSGRSAQERKQ